MFACCIFYTCKKDNSIEDSTPSPTPTPSAQNLIQNGSFETGGQPTTQGWYHYYSWKNPPPLQQIDTNTYFKYKQDAPGGGGNWSLKIFGGEMFQGARSSVYRTGIKRGDR